MAFEKDQISIKEEKKSTEEEFAPSSLSARQLKFGYWLVTHREQLRRWLIISLVVLIISFFVALLSSPSI